MIEDRAKLAKNSISLLLMNVFEKAFGFLSTIIVARLLGAADYGIFTAAFAFSSLFISFFEMGLPLIIPRFISQFKEGTSLIISGALAIIFLIYPLIFVLVIAYLYFFSWGTKDIPIVIASLALLNQAVFGIAKIFKGVYLGFERVSFDSAYTFFSKLLLCVLLFLLFFTPSNIKIIFSCYILSNLLYLGAMAFLLKFIGIRFKFKFNFELTKKLISNMGPLVMVSIFYNIYMSIDSLIIFNKLGADAAGYFGAAKRIYMTLMFVPAAINMAFFPAICKKISDSNELKNLIKLNVRALLVISLPIAIFMIIYSKEIIALAFGANFVHSYPLLQYMMPTILFASFTGLFGNIMYAQHKLRLFIFMSFVGLVTNVLSNVILINMYGVSGGALAVVTTELSMLIIGVYIFRKEIKNNLLK